MAESNDSNKDLYRPDDVDHMQGDSEDDDDESRGEIETEVEVENKDGAECEKDVIGSKKGKKAKKAKLGHHEIEAIWSTVPTTGTKSAVEHSKHHEWSPR